jgi:hypothetical protein
MFYCNLVSLPLVALVALGSGELSAAFRSAAMQSMGFQVRVRV